MKTILFLIPSLHARGAERVLITLVNSLDKSRYRVTVQTLFDVGPLRGEIQEGVEYLPGIPFLLRGNVFLQKIFTPAFLYKTIVRKRYDIVVAYLEGVTTRIIAGCPYHDSRKIAWVHSVPPDSSSFGYCYRTVQEAYRCYQSFDKVVSVSHSVRESLTQVAGVSSVAVHNVIDPDYIRAKAAIPVSDVHFSSSINLISLGALIGVKGYDRLLKVHKRLLEAGVKHHIYILGEGPERPRLEQQIQQLAVSDTFHLLGQRPNPYPYLAQADLYVCSSLSEGFSTATTEALILGKPIVSTSCGGAYELLGENNEYGIVTSNGEDALFEGLCQLLAHPDLLHYYSHQAVIRSGSFSKSQTLDLHYQLFK